MKSDIIKPLVVLNIDPGLRNLALCIMNDSDEILLWDVYDILDSDDYRCVDLCKNGNICNKKCSLQYSIDNKIIYTCKTHFPKNIPKKIFKKKNIKDYLLQDIASTFIKRFQEIYKTNEVIFNILTNVYIENQPRCNAKMVFISHILYGKLVDLLDNTVTIRFVRASQKLKAYSGPNIICSLKGAYAKRKWLSVQYTIWFLENKFSLEQREKWLPYFQSKMIKPDLGDTFLMSINSINRQQPFKSKKSIKNNGR